MRKLADYSFRNLVTSPPDETAHAAAVKMESRNVGCVLVTVEKDVVGIATRYDFIHGIIVGGKDPKRTRIDQIMHASPVSIDASATSAEALKTMIQRKVERLVVRSGKQILGIISLEDIVSNFEIDALSHLSHERQEQVSEMVKRLTPCLVSRYNGEEKEWLQREMNDETKALLRLLEELEISLR